MNGNLDDVRKLLQLEVDAPCANCLNRVALADCMMVKDQYR